MNNSKSNNSWGYNRYGLIQNQNSYHNSGSRSNGQKKSKCERKRQESMVYCRNKNRPCRKKSSGQCNSGNAKITQIKKDYCEQLSLLKEDRGESIISLDRRKNPADEQVAVNITVEEWTNCLRRLYNTEEQADLWTVSNNIDNNVREQT